jgi:magnesium transporter
MKANYNEACQLYNYTAVDIQVEKNSPLYFSTQFNEALKNQSSVYWLNFHDIECKDEITALCESIGIDKLTIDDIFEEQLRPKVEAYPNYLFFTVQSALPSNFEDVHLDNEKITFVLGEKFLISFQEKSSDHFTSVRERLLHNKGKIRTKGPDFLLFRMLEAIIDNYFEVLEYIVKVIEELEFNLYRNSSSEMLMLIELQKRKLVELRKIVIPIKEITIQLMKTKNEILEAENSYYFSQLRDDSQSVLDEIDGHRQVLEGMTNLYYAIQGQKMNEIMKVLTVVSAIFIPLTFIVGVYGMNFENMPELKYQNGYYVVIGVMLFLALGLLSYFIRKGWLQSSRLSKLSVSKLIKRKLEQLK